MASAAYINHHNSLTAIFTMKLTLVVLALVAAALAAPKISKPAFRDIQSPRIIGGQEATPHSLPYQAFLVVSSSSAAWYCNGALISENYVLTTAFCVDGANQVTVTLGAHRILDQEDSQVVLVSTEIKIHEDYTGGLDNDIAVIRLPSSVRITAAIRQIFLPSPDDTNDYEGALATVGGWGVTDAGGSALASVLNFLQVLVISNADCSTVYGNIGSSVVCTSGIGNVGICDGDSGSPLVTDGVVVGLTSFASENCANGLPSGFTRVTGYVPWILNNTDV